MDNPKLQKIDAKKQANPNYECMNGMYHKLDANQFGVLPYKSSLICLNLLYRMEKIYLSKVINMDHREYHGTFCLDEQTLYQLLEKITNIFENKINKLTIITINYDKLQKKAKVIKSDEKFKFYKNLGNLEYSQKKNLKRWLFQNRRWS